MEKNSDKIIKEDVNAIKNITVKKENLNEDEIKEFAETAMSELLGWYGYENPRDETILLPSSSSTPANDSKTTNTSTTNSVEVEGKRAQTIVFAGNNSNSPLGSPKTIETDCGWCGEMVDESGGISSSTANYCSELCFTQSRRASFKRHKTCDWCRQIRNSISYVDFQDGVSQLQFCSDRCLNQYKMHIFCRETRAHLQMHPHLHTDTSSGNLITPDLWLRNCKSPVLNIENNTGVNSTVTNSTISTSDIITNNNTENNKKNSSESEEDTKNTVPGISVVPPSKLMSTVVNMEKRQRFKNNSSVNKRKRNTNTVYTMAASNTNNNNNQPEDLRIFKPTVPIREFEKNETNRTEHFKTDKSDININNVNENGKKMFSNLLPPATILIPYPILLPVPLPLPIPIPVPKNLIKEYFPQSSLNIDNVDANSESVKTTNMHQADSKNTNEDISDRNKMELPLNLDIKKMHNTKSDLSIVDSNENEKSDNNSTDVNNVMSNSQSFTKNIANINIVDTKSDNIIGNANKSTDSNNTEINLRSLRKRRKVWANNINHFNNKNNSRKRNK